MTDYLKLKQSNCKNCYKCIRNCPIKSIRFSDNQANIINDECILCGQCFVVCPQNAKEIKNDTEVAKKLIESGKPVYASIAPSFRANYSNATIHSMESALLKLGFTGAEETAVGATIVKHQYDQLVDKSSQNIMITSCCHTINIFIQKYYPEIVPYLLPVISPMQAHCMDLKNRYPDAKTVFIGPCISKKAEADSYPEYVDCVLTFEELSSWLKDENIDPDSLTVNCFADDSYIDNSYNYNNQAENRLAGKTRHKNDESRARLFPVTGGILRTMKASNPEYTYLAIDGIANCTNALEDILKGKPSKCFIEMSACSGSCIGGPAMEKSHSALVRNYIAINNYAGEKDFPVRKYNEASLKKEIHPMTIHKVNPGKSAIEKILKEMGKTKPEDELNCGSCGYNTCRDKARAVLLGKADLTMCLPYLKEKAESFSDNIIRNSPNAIIVLDEMLKVRQINASACKLVNIHHPQDILGDHVVRILDPLPFIEVSQQGQNSYNHRVYLAEYQKYVDQTIIIDKSYHIMICIMRDITNEVLHQKEIESMRRATIDITDKVIEKQMRTVQEIASLLGETTAETKVALTKLKELLDYE